VDLQLAGEETWTAMITCKPEFLRGKHYQYKRWEVLCMLLLTDLHIKLDVPCHNVVLRHRGKELARIQDGWLIIRAGYAWNGCSPKWKLLWFVCGTPDPECTRLASLVHDLLYQFLLCPGFPFTRQECDYVFWDLMGDWWLRGTYHHAVNKLGGRFAKYDPDCTIEILLL
jgi:hypothetical protein